MTMPTSRAEAKALGLAYYFTGEPCVRSHICKRITANGCCHQCVLDDKRAKRSKKPGYRTRAEMDAELAKPLRKCSACGNEYPATSEFFVTLKKKQPSGTVTIGFSRECRTCRNKRYQPYYEKHRDEIIERISIDKEKLRADPNYRIKDREWSRKSKARQLADPIERFKHNARGALWRKQNPDRAKKFKHEHRAMKAYRAMQRLTRVAQATPPWLTKDHKEWIKGLYVIANFLTELTGVEHEVEHIYPISPQRSRSCGLNVPWNLRIMTKEENLRKTNIVKDGWLLDEVSGSDCYATDANALAFQETAYICTDLKRLVEAMGHMAKAPIGPLDPHV